MHADSQEIIAGLASIRSVSNPPGVVHVARAADLSASDYLGVSRYSASIRAELCVGTHHRGTDEKEAQFELGTAWHLVALLKLIASPSLYCPAVSGVSWDAVAAIDDNSVVFREDGAGVKE